MVAKIWRSSRTRFLTIATSLVAMIPYVVRSSCITQCWHWMEIRAWGDYLGRRLTIICMLQMRSMFEAISKQPGPGRACREGWPLWTWSSLWRLQQTLLLLWGTSRTFAWYTPPEHNPANFSVRLNQAHPVWKVPLCGFGNSLQTAKTVSS